MFSVGFQNIIWRAVDAETAGLLDSMADFAGFSRLDSANGVPVSSVGEAQLLEMAQAEGALSGYCTVLNHDGIGVLRGIADEAHGRSGLFKQLFYCGLLPYFSEEKLPIHGALAGRSGKGILFLGQSGMGKSTAMTRLSAAGWEIIADDAVLLNGQSGVGLPTWSCGYSGAPRQFQSGAEVELNAIVELERGMPELIPLAGVRVYGGLLRGFNDLFSQFDHGWPQEQQQKLRRMAMEYSSKLAGTLPVYRLPLNLEDEFAPLLEDIL